MNEQGPIPEDHPKESPVIKIPEDPVLRWKLERKLEEYETRVRRIDTLFRATRRVQGDEKARELKASYASKKEHYKAFVLKRLLETGEIRAWDLNRELVEKEGSENCNDEAFAEACAIIHSYVDSSLPPNEGGTGLPDVPPEVLN
jgi:hypothetical protein